MKYVNLAGPIKELDRVIETYLSKYEIQLEYAVKELHSTGGIESFTSPNPYAALYHEALNLAQDVPMPQGETDYIEPDDAERVIREAASFFVAKKAETEKLGEKRRALNEIIENVSHFSKLKFDVADLSKFTHIDYRFGHMPVGGYKQFEAYLFDDSQILFEKADSDGENVWCVYFAPHASIKKVDVMFSSFHFSAFDFPAETEGEILSGGPYEIIQRLKEKLEHVSRKDAEWKSETPEVLGIPPERIHAAYNCIKKLYMRYDCRKYACKTVYDYFMFIGWMSAKEAKKLSQSVENDEGVVLVQGDPDESAASKPPTKLRNNPLFRPFEFLIRMYGVPSYGEVDPTPFVALTYSLFFGIMFGDVGQGAALSVIGFLLAKFKKSAIGSILTIVGLFSIIFGFMFGSVFGFETVIEARWLRPAEDIMTLVYSAVALGAVTVVACMIYNIINAVKKKDLGKLLFSPNGISGIVLYISTITIALLIMVAGVKVSGLIIAACVALPLILIAFKEPLTNLVTKKKEEKHGDARESLGLFLFVTVMELVEVVLSYFTNTLSFVRVAGYAISHAGLMSVVMILAGSGGRKDIAVVILGNIFVMGLEGLVVFIQVMRLQYYEMFSRYYEGSGKEFVAYKNI